MQGEERTDAARPGGHPASLADPRVVGRYALFDEIASGGMATVHLGRLIGPVGFSRTVAIKRLHPGYAKDPEFVSMFVDEARLAARVRHPNVVPVLDVVRTNDELFLVMEYIQGESLARILALARRRGQPVPVRYVVAIMLGVLHGLHAAHEATGESGELLNIVHRDVSPQNVLVGTDGVSRVFDFGIAKARGRLQTTAEGQVKGKLQYMSPEQVSGRTIGREADIYAAGVVLWESLTGRSLFRGETDMMLLAQVLQGARVPPSHHREDLAAAVDEVVMRALAVSPKDRFGSARDMAVALEDSSHAASALQVGEWVEQIATRSLELRAQRIKSIESHPGLPAPPADSQPDLVQVSPTVVHNPDTVVDAFEPGQVNPDAKTIVGPASPSPVQVVDRQEVEPATRLAHEVDQAATLPGPEVERARRRRLRRSLLLAAGAIVAGVVLLVARWPDSPTTSPPTEAEPAEQEPGRTVASAAATGAEQVVQAPPAETTAPASVAAEAASATAATARPSVAEPSAATVSPPAAAAARPPASATAASASKPTAARAPAPPKAGCDPPYTIDARGIRRLKPQCL